MIFPGHRMLGRKFRGRNTPLSGIGEKKNPPFEIPSEHTTRTGEESQADKEAALRESMGPG